MQLLTYVVAFVVAIGILVTVHEFGHFWVARRLGIKVLRFSVGFGRPLISRRLGADRTEFVIAAIPLGGYVKMLDESEDDDEAGERHRAFNRQSPGVRSAVAVAGPLANFLFAIVVYAAMFMFGVTGLRPIVGEVHADSVAAAAGFRSGDRIEAVAGQEVARWESAIQAVLAAALDGDPAAVAVRDAENRSRVRELDLGRITVDDLTQGQFFTTLGIEPERPRLPPTIGQVISGGAAARAGMEPGDRVLSAGGEPIATWADWVAYVRARPEQTFAIEVARGDARVTLDITPAAEQEGSATIGRIGAGVADIEHHRKRYYVSERYGPWESLSRGFVKTGDVTALTLRMFWRMLTGEVSLANLSGPISIGQYAGLAAERGLSDFLYFLGVVSVGLGILNLLPVPLLDGGHLLYYAAEWVRGRPLSEEVQFVGQRLGIALLVGLMGLAFYNDLARVFG